MKPLRLLGQCDPNRGLSEQLAARAMRGDQGRPESVWPGCGGDLAGHRAAALADVLQYLRDFTLTFADQRRHTGHANFHDLLTWARDLLLGPCRRASPRPGAV